MDEEICSHGENWIICVGDSRKSMQNYGLLYTILALFLYILEMILPHRGLPPCCGGGAYAPITRTII